MTKSTKRDPRCAGCGCQPTHWYDTAISRNAVNARAARAKRKGIVIHGWKMCLECIALWVKHGRYGTVRQMEVAS